MGERLKTAETKVYAIWNMDVLIRNVGAGPGILAWPIINSIMSLNNVFSVFHPIQFSSQAQIIVFYIITEIIINDNNTFLTIPTQI